MKIAYINFLSSLIIIALVIAFGGCDDFFEKDISDYSLDLYYPSDSLAYNGDTIRFLWSEVNNVTSYNLKIINKNFSTQGLIVDTLVPQNSFNTLLAVGNYEWQVSGLNSIYQTQIASRNLKIYPQQSQLVNESVVLLSPTNQLKTTDNNISFWWESIDIAPYYNLQVVTPNFNSPQSMLLDTTLTQNSFSLSLIAGNYEWRVCALDSISQTEYIKRNFTIIKDPNFEDETVRLLAPKDKLNTTSETITFWWDKIDKAESYNLQVVKPKFDSIEELILDTLTNEDSYTLDIIPGEYEWRVCAINSSEQKTQYSTRSLFIDNENNLQNEDVILIAPTNNLRTSTKTLTFWWEEIDQATSYVLQIVSPDFQHAELLILDEKLQGNSKVLTLDPGNYQWRVKAVNEFSETNFTTNSLTVLP